MRDEQMRCKGEWSKMFDYEKECCDDCLNCVYYWQNTDTEYQCEGENEPCPEYIEFKGMGH